MTRHVEDDPPRDVTEPEVRLWVGVIQLALRDANGGRANAEDRRDAQDFLQGERLERVCWMIGANATRLRAALREAGEWPER